MTEAQPFHPYVLSCLLQRILAEHARRDEYLHDNFVVAGSYPAAVWALPHDLHLPYHDVDVYVFADLNNTKSCNDSTDESASDYGSWGPSIRDQWKEFHTIGGRGTEINIIVLLGWHCLNGIIRAFDINCVKAGFEVRRKGFDATKLASETLDIGDGHFSRYDYLPIPLFNRIPKPTVVQVSIEWGFCPEYVSFLNNKILMIDNPAECHAGACSIVRLVFKAQDLHLPLILPPGFLLAQMDCAKPLPKSALGKYDALLPAFKAMIDNVFQMQVVVHKDEEDKNEDDHGRASPVIYLTRKYQSKSDYTRNRPTRAAAPPIPKQEWTHEVPETSDDDEHDPRLDTPLFFPDEFDLIPDSDRP
jgi:hypothetical protein